MKLAVKGIRVWGSPWMGGEGSVFSLLSYICAEIIEPLSTGWYHIVLQTYDSSTREVQTRRPEFQGHLQLFSVFEASLGYMELCVNKIK